MSFGTALILGLIGSGLIYMITWAANSPRRASHRVVAAAGWLWAAGVVGLTFGTRSGGGQAVNTALLDLSKPADRIDFLLNTTMFVRAGTELPGDGANRTAAPGFRVGVGALRAQRRLPGAAVGLGDDAAVAAGHPSLLAAVAPGLAGGPGHVAERRPPADAALRGDPRPAVLAAWAIR